MRQNKTAPTGVHTALPTVAPIEKVTPGCVAYTVAKIIPPASRPTIAPIAPPTSPPRVPATPSCNLAIDLSIIVQE